MVYSSNATNGLDNYFRVIIRQVYLGTSPGNATPLFNASELNLVPFGTIVDTGTAVSTFPTSWYSILNQGWLNKVGIFFDPYLAFTEAQLNDVISTFPTLYFQLVGDDNQNAANGLAASFDPNHPLDVIVALPPSKYIQALGSISTTQYYGPQFLFSDMNQTILGENIIAGHDVHFDYLNNRIGWADSNCGYARVVPPPKPKPSAKPIARPIASKSAPRPTAKPSKKA